MSEAEKKWEDSDDNNRYHLDYPKTKPEVSRDSREAYKAALRREIEKRIKIIEPHISEHEIDEDDWLLITSRVNELRKIIQLLNTVEP